MRHRTWQYLIDWTTIMARTHGGTVWDKNGAQWDWGQALMRELYGPDWMNEEAFNELDDTPDTEPVPDDVIQRARKWYEGDWPEWVGTEPVP